MRARVLDGLAQLVDDILWCRQIGIAHTKIDNVGPARSRRCLQAIDLFKDIRGKRRTLWNSSDMILFQKES